MLLSATNKTINEGNLIILRSISEFTVFEDNTIGNTGMTYDSYRDLLVHGRYDYTTSSKLVFTKKTGEYVDELDVTSLIDHIQGIAYNSDNDSFYIWGTEKGVTHEPWTQGIELIEVDRDGDLLSSHKFDNYINYPGMLDYVSGQGLWVKANTQTIAYLYDTSDWSLLDQVETNVAGEGLAINNEGHMIVHDGTNVKKIRISDGVSLKSEASPTKHGQSESVVVDDLGAVYIGADEGLHNNEPGGNKVWILDF